MDVVTLVGTTVGTGVSIIGAVAGMGFVPWRLIARNGDALAQGTNMTPDQLFAVIGSTVGSVTVVGLALAVLILRVTSRLDADQHAFQARFDTAMDTFRTEMQRLAERQSHVEGRVDQRGTATD